MCTRKPWPVDCTKRSFFCRWVISAVLVLSLGGHYLAADNSGRQRAGSRPNVLLICVDDLRCELGCYGVKGIQTPNIDRLVHWENVKTKKTVLVELYDHRNDPLETNNIAATEQEVVQRLSKQLTRGATALPDRNTADGIHVVSSAAGQYEIRECDQPVLRYNYRIVEPPEGYLDRVSVNNRKYARARSDYIHPLYGPDGEQLTKDWSIDHPHHRGIYWAWPEVDYRGDRGDLHALQRVFARPTGKIQLRNGDGFAEIEAENQWQWDDKTPIVRETTTIRAHTAGDYGRYVDLTFELVALADDVDLARRGTKTYGGLNIRLTPVAGLKLVHHVDPQEASPRRAWQSAAGTWQGGAAPASLTVLEHADNPDYPGDYVQYPNLPWFQPTFPRSGTRYSLKKGEPLVLKYRLWIRRGEPPVEAECRAAWQAFHTSPANEG